MKKQSVTKGFAILSIAGMMAKVFSLIYIPVLINILTDQGYGIYAAAYQIFLFIFVLTNSGIPVAISKLVSELIATENYKDALKSFRLARYMLLFLGFVMALFTIGASGFLSKRIGYPEAQLSVLALAPSILFTSVASAYRGYFQGMGNMTPTAISQVIEQLVNIIFSLLFAAMFIKYGLEAGCAGGTVGTSLGALVSALFLIYCHRKNGAIKVKDKDSIKDEKYSVAYLMKKIIHYGLPITLCVGMNSAGVLVDVSNTKARLMVAGFNEVNATILYGHLAKYQQLMNVPIAIISSLSMAVLPVIAGAAAKGDKKQVKSNINYAFRSCFLIAIPAAVGLGSLADPIYKMLHIGGGVEIMRYGVIVLVLMAVAQIQTTILQSIGKLYAATLYSLIGICFKILTNYLLIANPSINIMGAIYGSAIGFLIPIILNHRMIKKSLKVKFSLILPAIRPFIAGSIMGFIIVPFHSVINHALVSVIKKVYISNAVGTMAAVILGVFIYAYSLILIGGVRKKDLDRMPSKLIKFIPKFVRKRIR
ncbi:polysaccharide biosynthesis family protein [Clostridium sporogenes]|uniref:Polysaccharide biosynthesis family protein n=1 Tax=Clostridium sporogenes TaxID=1509 RepID=A0A1L3NG75_CLOSG|nr:polysaccharide biosynthesis protein [Clostridium sporogenes]APH15135.1 polysaccharide biosynthesis family protein [Clostridium sporogenes]